jgi:hypothetical protein
MDRDSCALSVKQTLDKTHVVLEKYVGGGIYSRYLQHIYLAQRNGTPQE